MEFYLFLLLCLTQYFVAGEKNEVKGNILYLMPVPSPSHHIWNRVLWKALAKDGYNVTAVSVELDKESTPNLHQIHLAEVYDILYKPGESVSLIEMSSLGPLENLKASYSWSSSSCKSVMQTSGIKTLLNYPKDFKFDLIIYDTTKGPCLLPFLDRFPKAPLISVSGFFMPKMMYEYGGSPLFPSLFPHLSLTISQNMNLFQRIRNLFMHATELYYLKTMVADHNVVLRKYFGPEMKDLSSFGKRTELYLVNGHPAMQHPEPVMPNVIQVGGLQIKKPSPLPQDIEQFISSSDKGAVFFSLGTNMKSEMLGEEKTQMFINAIKRLPQYNFLWKFEPKTLTSLPKNVMIKKWFSQNDILAHPKIKLFLSHTGLLSSQEAVWYGVPVLAMPFYGDQPYNTHKLIEDGVAEKLDFATLSEENIYNTLKQILENPSYEQKMKQRSAQFRDRPEHPLDLALFWCRYILRNGNAQHLRSPAMEMSHFVQHMWDVLLVLVGVALGILFAVSKLICSLTKQKKNSVKVKTN